MNFIASLEPHVIMYILSSISEGLTALGNYLPSFGACKKGSLEKRRGEWALVYTTDIKASIPS